MIVTDSSPLHYLRLIEAENVLATLFGQVAVPDAVFRELTH